MLISLDFMVVASFTSVPYTAYSTALIARGSRAQCAMPMHKLPFSDSDKPLAKRYSSDCAEPHSVSAP